jgi:murein tripeptide amidase MpaA
VPPSGYLTTTAIEQCLVWLNTAYPTFTQLHPFGTSEHGRPIRAIRIRAGAGDRNGALLMAGTHARELINPDCLVGLAFKLCWAYDNNLGLVFGDKEWSRTEVRLLVDGMDIFIVPNINPDGREYVQTTPGPPDHEKWRKNRRANADGTIGADLNRNFDFLWKWTIGNTSSVSTKDTYKGDAVFSERETRNVRDFLDAHPQITCFVDVHSYSQLILYPWGDDENQSADPAKNFLNSVWDGLRGFKSDAYGEYSPSVDEGKYIDRANKIRDAIAAVHGRTYKVQQGFDLYGTSGASSDYAYSRFFRGPRRKIWAFALETNRAPMPGEDPMYGFQPPFPDALHVMEEVQSGLIQFMLACLCVVREVGRRRFPEDVLDGLRLFRDSEMARGRRGRRWIELLDTHGDELLGLLAADSRALESAEGILAQGVEIVVGREGDEPPTIDRQLASRIERLATRLEKKASPQLRKALAGVRKDAPRVVGKTAHQAIR